MPSQNSIFSVSKDYLKLDLGKIFSQETMLEEEVLRTLLINVLPFGQLIIVLHSYFKYKYLNILFNDVDGDISDHTNENKEHRNKSIPSPKSSKEKKSPMGLSGFEDDTEPANKLPKWINLDTEMNNSETAKFYFKKLPSNFLIPY